MPLYIGRTAKGGIIKEASWGTAGNANTFIPIVSESIQDKIEKVIFPAGSGTLFPQAQYHGARDLGGSFTMYMDPDNFGLLAYMTLGSEANAANGGAANVYDHVITPANSVTDLGSFTMEMQRGANNYTYSGMTVNTWTLNMVRGGLLQSTFDVVGKTVAENGTANLSPGSKVPYTFGMGNVAWNGTGKTYVTSATLVYTNALDADGAFTLSGNTFRGHVPHRQAPGISGTLECEWTPTSDALRQEILTNAGLTNLTFTFISPTAITGAFYYTITIVVPAVTIQGDYPVVSTMDRLPMTINFTGMNAANAITVTLKDGTATKWSA